MYLLKFEFSYVTDAGMWALIFYSRGWKLPDCALLTTENERMILYLTAGRDNVGLGVILTFVESKI